MEKLIGIYVLRENADLSFHLLPPEPGADAVHAWPLRDDRFDFMRIVVEAGALGARPRRIVELVEKWKITNDDGREFARRTGINLEFFDDTKTWLAEDPDAMAAASGTTALIALIALYKLLSGKETLKNGNKETGAQEKGDA